MSPRPKIVVTSKSPVGDISVVTLIRTDTTLDHSQKAEKVWLLPFEASGRCVLAGQLKQSFELGWKGNQEMYDHSVKRKSRTRRGESNSFRRKEKCQANSSIVGWGPRLPQKLKESH